MLAAVDKESESKMPLIRFEYEVKQKELETDLHRLEEESALKLQNEKEALEARDSGSDDGAVVSIRSRSPSIGKVQGARTSSAGSTNQISLQTLKTAVLIIQRTGASTIESILTEKAYLNLDLLAASVSNPNVYRIGLSAI